MRHVARFLLKSGISYKEFADVSRAAFVSIATDDYGIRGRPTNVSRVSAMTGIGRKEVRRLRAAVQGYDADPSVEMNVLAGILHDWFTHPDYTEAGRPRLLDVKGERSFAELAKKHAGDLPAGAIKAELIRAGAASELADGRLCALRRDLIPPAVDERLILCMDLNLRTHTSTIAYNCDPERHGESKFDRVVYSERIPVNASREVREALHKRAVVFTREIDDFLALAEDEDPTASHKKLGIGIYYFED